MSARLIGVDSSVVSRRFESGKTRMSNELQDLVRNQETGSGR
jgi:hypothetical protein